MTQKLTLCFLIMFFLCGWGATEDMPWQYKVALGEFGDDFIHIHKFGELPDLGTSDTDITPWGDKLFPPASGMQLAAVSSAADTMEIEIQGLDENWDIKTVNQTLTGTTKVSLTGLWTDVYRVKNNSSTPAAGTIYISKGDTAGAGDTPGDSANIVALISVGEEQTLQAAMRTPRGYDVLMTDWDGSLNSSLQNIFSAKVTVKVTPFGGVQQTKERHGSIKTGTTLIGHNPDYPTMYGEKSTIVISAEGSTNTGTNPFAATFDVLLIKKGR